MPRRRNDYGANARPRDGAKIILATPAAGARIELPPNIGTLTPEAAQAWEWYWTDPVSQATTPASRGLLHRWIDALNRYWWALEMADAEPVVSGSKIDNPRPSPYYKIAQDNLTVAKSCEYQLGIGARNQLGLGMAIADATLAKNAAANSVDAPRKAPRSITTERRDPRMIEDQEAS